MCFRGACLIEAEPEKYKLEDLAIFKFYKDTYDETIVEEFCSIVPQEVYNGVSGSIDDVSPIRCFDLTNIQMSRDFKRMLEGIMKITVILIGNQLDLS